MAFEFPHGVENGLVLGLYRDEVLALALVELGRAFEREVDRFGGTRSPYDLARVGVDQFRNVAAALFNGLFCLPTPRMTAGGRIAEVLAQPGNHCVDDARIDGRGCAVVKIDGEMRSDVHGWLLLALVKLMIAAIEAPEGALVHRIYDFAKTFPRANTEFGALMRIGLTTGCAEIARLMTGLFSIWTPLASWSSTSFCKVTESRNSTMR